MAVSVIGPSASGEAAVGSVPSVVTRTGWPPPSMATTSESVNGVPGATETVGGATQGNGARGSVSLSHSSRLV